MPHSKVVVVASPDLVWAVMAHWSCYQGSCFYHPGPDLLSKACLPRGKKFHRIDDLKAWLSKVEGKSMFLGGGTVLLSPGAAGHRWWCEDTGGWSSGQDGQQQRGTRQLREQNLAQLCGGEEAHGGPGVETHRPDWQGMQSIVPLRCVICPPGCCDLGK